MILHPNLLFLILAPFHPPYLPETFDKVLLDAPCSGLGQRPQLKYSLKLSEYCSYQVYQRKLIKQVSVLLVDQKRYLYNIRQ